MPAWTLSYNVKTPGSRWIGTAWEFFDDEVQAQRRFDELRAADAYPTKRPYHSYDRVHLGAAHALSGEG
jgi:hypothetical protein